MDAGRFEFGFGDNDGLPGTAARRRNGPGEIDRYKTSLAARLGIADLGNLALPAAHVMPDVLADFEHQNPSGNSPNEASGGSLVFTTYCPLPVRRISCFFVRARMTSRLSTAQ